MLDLKVRQDGPLIEIKGTRKALLMVGALIAQLLNERTSIETRTQPRMTSKVNADINVILVSGE